MKKKITKINMSMKNFKNLFLILSMFMLLVFSSCQEEEAQINPPQETEILQAGSSTVNALGRVATNDGSVDNILDNTSCFSIELPVTVEANGITITIETIDGLDVIEEIFNLYDTDVDTIDFLFPITIISGDHTEIVINSQEEFEVFIEECIEPVDNDFNECVDFVYPIVFSIYNTDFQVIETVTINSDEELYLFLDMLENIDNNIELVSLNFPVSLIYVDGTTVEVNSNQELEDALYNAEEYCDDEDDECDIENIESLLTECVWYIEIYNDDEQTFENFDVYFGVDGSVEMFNGDTAEVIAGAWSISSDGNIEISNITPSYESYFNGTWAIEDCDEGILVLVRDNDLMILEQDCDDDEDFSECILNVLKACEVDPNTGNPEPFNLYEVIECNLITTLAFDFFETQDDANNLNNPIQNAQNYPYNQSTVYIAIYEVSTNHVVYVQDIELIYENCTNNTCSQQEVEAHIIECVWNIVNYNGDNQLEYYNLEFNENNVLLVEGNGQTITTTWQISQDNAGNTTLVFGDIALPNIQAISGEWTFVACANGEFGLVNPNNDEMHMLQDCD